MPELDPLMMVIGRQQLPVFAAHIEDLDRLAHSNRRRVLAAREGVDFASNDYLGLATSRQLQAAVHEALDRGVPIGSGGSRLLRGNHEEHEALEAEAAAFFGSSTALYFASGYSANSTLLSTLPQRQDIVFYDELIHASCREGLRLSRATTRDFRHNDSQHLQDQIGKWRRDGAQGQPWIVVESLYSMDGDQAPLEDLAIIAKHSEAILIIDEAHATGVFGTLGRGLTEALQPLENVITVRTCGKALGCEGALICGGKIVRDFLVNRGRGFIFSTAPSPLMAAAVRASLRILSLTPRLQAQLWDLVSYAGEKLSKCGVTVTGSQILPLILGDNRRVMRVAGLLQARGFDVRGIRPPTVPEGTSRLRLSLTLNADKSDVARLAETLREVL